MLPLLLSWLHATNDLFGAFLTPLLPKLQVAYGVGYGTVSLLVAIYSLSGSLLQPVAGLIADRYDRRVLAALGPVLVALGGGLMGFFPTPLALGLMLACSGLGSALFHSAAAALVGQYANPARRGFWLSFFSTGGYVGMAMAPALSLSVVNAGGLKALSWLVPLAFVPAVLLLWKAPAIRLQTKPSTFSDLARVFKGQVARLWAVSTLRSVVFMSFSTTIPFWFAQRGLSDEWVKITLTAYSVSATAGAFLGGTLSDRLGRRAVLVGTMVCAIPLYVALLVLPPEHWLFVGVLSLTGALMNAGVPTAVAMAQEHEPKQMATVSGLLMGFTWGFAGLLYGAVGPLVERFGVIESLSVMGLLLIPALTLSLAVREARPQVALGGD
ncbi:MAG: MFS transporter [Deinococcota bacterium]|uniref:Major facilitator superfamily MFS_1 n=1 Tax=Allomeiothermus silvanus (strain ATCC 700542 / DSM 9946 / NBRC 106475 / NCIMB 13440 / VI-R2) TaxID=526227 RepID=D7BGP3_ALLS1|nr:MFS transporter [Allomeiothermus silvanus]ADH62047.1 major facilitator superfamily MFS_1 [Allomeiothermus silvanus DSM 9946]MBI5812731.1 MFS transporter [Allomeiothermus silvanus]